MDEREILHENLGTCFNFDLSLVLITEKRRLVCNLSSWRALCVSSLVLRVLMMTGVRNPLALLSVLSSVM
jgi:hypothetical protein